MQLITAESVEQVCTRMWNMSEGDAFKLSYLMEKEQPVLLAYLAAVDKNILNQPERELMFYLATAVWQIMSSDKQPLPSLNEEQLLRFENINSRLGVLLTQLANPTFAETVNTMLKDCRQAEVLRYLISVLMDEEPNQSEIREENLGFII
jgi:hypothetical protein